MAAAAAAAVFYAHDAALTLYFLSEEKTQTPRTSWECRGRGDQSKADGQEWPSHRGIQLRGRVAVVAAGTPTTGSSRLWTEFVFCRRSDGGQRRIGSPACGSICPGAAARRRFWQLTPSWLRAD